MRDETGLNGLKITIDLKRGADPEKLMRKLMQHDARCMDTFACNFNVLIGGMPQVHGRAARSWRNGPPGGWSCVRRRVYYDLQQASRKSSTCCRA